MKKIISVIIVLAFIISCTQKTKKVTETFDDGTPKLEQIFKKDSLVKEITFYKNHLI